jgi:hypothetical protein
LIVEGVSDKLHEYAYLPLKSRVLGKFKILSQSQAVLMKVLMD